MVVHEVHMGMGQVLVFVSIYQGSLLGNYPFFDPHPYGNFLPHVQTMTMSCRSEGVETWAYCH